MYRCLSPGAIGIGANLEEGLRLAKLGEFGGLEVNIGEIADRVESEGKDAVLDRFRQAGIKPGGFGLPVDWRTKDEEKLKSDLERLNRLAAAGQAIGCTRTSTWILPFSDERPMDANIDWHVERFTPIANVLRDHGCSLGLEFIGPKTLRNGRAHEFVYDMMGMLDMAEKIGPNVGLLLDCWHWYTAGNTAEQLAGVSPEKIVYVHVNDAPAGVPVDEQIDSKRAMPGETGVIDIRAFLQTLQQIGYDGPVTPEPFSEKVKGISPDEAARMTGESMKKIWQIAGLS